MSQIRLLCIIATILIIFYVMYILCKDDNKSRVGRTDGRNDNRKNKVSLNVDEIPITNYSFDPAIINQQLYIIKEYANAKLFKSAIPVNYNYSDYITLSDFLGCYINMEIYIPSVSINITDLKIKSGNYSRDNRYLTYELSASAVARTSISLDASVTYGIVGSRSGSLTTEVNVYASDLSLFCKIDCIENKVVSVLKSTSSSDISVDISIFDSVMNSLGIAVVGYVFDVKSSIYNRINNVINSNIDYTSIISSMFTGPVSLPMIYPLPPIGLCGINPLSSNKEKSCFQANNNGQIVDGKTVFNNLYECERINRCETSNFVNCFIREGYLVGDSPEGPVPIKSTVIESDYSGSNCGSQCSRLPCDECTYWMVDRTNPSSVVCNLYNDKKLSVVYSNEHQSGKRKCQYNEECDAE